MRDPAPRKRALHDLTKAAVDEHRARAEANAEAAEQERRRGLRTPYLIETCLVLSLVGAAMLVFRPAWLFTPPPPAQSTLITDAGIRASMYFVAEQLRIYRAANGRYPSALSDLTAVVPKEIAYEVDDAGGFVLRGPGVSGPLTLTSADDARAFLGNSLKIIKEQGR